MDDAARIAVSAMSRASTQVQSVIFALFSESAAAAFTEALAARSDLAGRPQAGDSDFFLLLRQIPPAIMTTKRPIPRYHEYFAIRLTTLSAGAPIL